MAKVANRNLSHRKLPAERVERPVYWDWARAVVAWCNKTGVDSPSLVDY